MPVVICFGRWSGRRFIDLYECRAVLEGLCARRAAGAVMPAEVTALEAVLDGTAQALDADDVTRVYELNSEFHRQLLAVGARSRCGGWTTR